MRTYVAEAYAHAEADAQLRATKPEDLVHDLLYCRGTTGMRLGGMT
jgi:hypothetical protein